MQTTVRLVLTIALAAAGWVAMAAEEPVVPEPTEGSLTEEGGATETLEGGPEDIVARVDDAKITRADLAMMRRQLAFERRGPLPNNDVLLDQLIDRVLLRRYFRQQNLLPTGQQVQRAIQRLDMELRRRGSSYQRWIAARGLTLEEHASLVAFDLAKQALAQRIRREITEEDIKAEFDAHPEWYDGSRVRVSQIFIRVGDASDPEEAKKAKERADKIYKELLAGKDFAQLARDFSDSASSARGGDRGWITRKGPEEDEPLRAAVWKLKVGQFTKPIKGKQGWHILKVTDREPARFTYFGAKPYVIRYLVNKKFRAILEKLRAKANIRKFL